MITSSYQSRDPISWEIPNVLVLHIYGCVGILSTQVIQAVGIFMQLASVHNFH